MRCRRRSVVQQLNPLNQSHLDGFWSREPRRRLPGAALLFSLTVCRAHCPQSSGSPWTAEPSPSLPLVNSSSVPREPFTNR